MVALLKKSFFILISGMALLTARQGYALSDSSGFPITRQTEQESIEATRAMLSGVAQAKYVSAADSPQIRVEYGKPLSGYLSFENIREVFIPYDSRDITEAQIGNILKNAVIVKYEELMPLHLLPGKYVTVTDTTGNIYGLQIFMTFDLRGRITLPNNQVMWFAVTGNGTEQ